MTDRWTVQNCPQTWQTSPVPVHTQVTPATLLSPFLPRFDVDGVESNSFRDVHVVQRARHH